MRAACYERYGPAEVVGVRDVPRPAIAEHEILVRVRASAVTTADWRLRASVFPDFAWLPGRMIYGVRAPRRPVLGSDFAGEVVARGARVRGGLEVGEAVFGVAGRGAHAEYLAIPASGAVARKPARLSFEEAAAVPFGALCALVMLRDVARLAPGQRVLVHGASGGVGVFAVQIARHLGAEVAGVCSAANRALVASLGADPVIDHAAEDALTRGETYDVILDTVGRLRFARCRRVLAPRGVFLPLEFGAREIAQALASRIAGGPRMITTMSGDRPDDLRLLADLLESGAIRPVIDGVYPLERIADAHRRVESRRKRGSVVLAIAPGEPVALAG